MKLSWDPTASRAPSADIRGGLWDTGSSCRQPGQRGTELTLWVAHHRQLLVAVGVDGNQVGGLSVQDVPPDDRHGENNHLSTLQVSWQLTRTLRVTWPTECSTHPLKLLINQKRPDWQASVSRTEVTRSRLPPYGPLKVAQLAKLSVTFYLTFSDRLQSRDHHIIIPIVE